MKAFYNVPLVLFIEVFFLLFFFFFLYNTMTLWLIAYSNCTRMLRAVLNKSWRQYPTKQQLYGHLPPITKTIRVRRTRHAEHCWRCKDGLISDTLQWTLSHGRTKAGRPARIYIQQLCADTGWSLEDLLGAMDEIRTGSSTWWWWWWLIVLLVELVMSIYTFCLKYYNKRYKYWDSNIFGTLSL